MIAGIIDSKSRIKAYGDTRAIIQALQASNPELILEAQRRLARGDLRPVLPEKVDILPVRYGSR